MVAATKNQHRTVLTDRFGAVCSLISIPKPQQLCPEQRMRGWGRAEPSLQPSPPLVPVQGMGTDPALHADGWGRARWQTGADLSHMASRTHTGFYLLLL